MKVRIIYLFFLGLISVLVFSFNEIDVANYSMTSLGKALFNDKILSKDYTISCASCHIPEFAFSDTTSLSIGINNKPTLRNTPSVLNMKNRPYYFWDGRASSLDEQALMPIQNPNEMGLPIEEAIQRLNESAFYNSYFNKVFKESPNKINIAKAFAAYEKTLETVDSKFDDWSNNLINLTTAEERGRKIFLGEKAKCFDCHFQEDFTNDDFKNIGLFDGDQYNDSGRYLVTKIKSDIGKFKTPGLRNISITAPYMHDGSFSTLEEVVDYYNNTKKKVPNSINIDPALSKPLGLSELEKKDLVAFLKTLSDKHYLSKKK